MKQTFQVFIANLIIYVFNEKGRVKKKYIFHSIKKKKKNH